MKSININRNLAILYLLGRVIKRQIENYFKVKKSQNLIKGRLTMSFENQDAIVVIDGSYKGWVGYAQGNEQDGIVPIKLFDFEGNVALQEYEYAEYLLNIEPKYTTIEERLGI